MTTRPSNPSCRRVEAAAPPARFAPTITNVSAITTRLLLLSAFIVQRIGPIVAPAGWQAPSARDTVPVPELPDVEAYRRFFVAHATGKTVADVWADPTI